MPLLDEIEAAKKFMQLVGPEETAKFIANMQIAVDSLTAHNQQFREAFRALKAVESPATDRQHLKAAIALVREAATLHIIGMGGFSEFMCGLDDIEQRAAV